MNYNEILKKGENILKRNKIKNPNLDTELILSKESTQKRRSIIKYNKKINNKDIINLKLFIKKKTKRTNSIHSWF